MSPKKKVRTNLDDVCGSTVIHLERVAKARNDAVPDKELDRLVRMFKVLGDQTRLKIVMALTGGEMCVCDLSAFLGVSDSAVSHQLRRLKDMALVKSRRDGQVLYYSLDDDHVYDLLGIGLEHVRED